MKKTTCTFSYGGRFFFSHTSRKRKNNDNQFLREIENVGDTAVHGETITVILRVVCFNGLFFFNVKAYKFKIGGT